MLPLEVRKLASFIKEKDAVLQERDKQIEAIQYENIGLQGEIRAKDQQIRRYEETVIHLRERYVNHTRDLGKGNIIRIVRKHTRPANDKYHDLPYYVSTIQPSKRYVNLRWIIRYFPNYEVIVEIDSSNSIYAFNRSCRAGMQPF